MIHQKMIAIARIIQIPEDYPNLLNVSCPFCGEVHQHRVSRAESLLGIPIHRIADNCWPFDMELGRKGLRRKRRQQLEEGKVLYERCDGAYHVPLFISLYARYRGGKLVGHRVGEVRK